MPRISLSAHCIESSLSKIDSRVQAHHLCPGPRAYVKRVCRSVQNAAITRGVGEFDWDFWSPFCRGFSPIFYTIRKVSCIESGTVLCAVLSFVSELIQLLGLLLAWRFRW